MKGNIRNALVIGGGIGGLCAAIALRQKNIAVDLIERDPAGNVWGIGIIHQANAVRAEAMLGVSDEIIRQGWAFSGGRIHNGDGVLLQDFPGLPLGAGDLPSDVGITRPRLAKVLYDRACKLGADIRHGFTARVIDNSDAGAHVRFHDGSEKQYDLVVGADGIYSSLRKELWDNAHPAKFSGQGGWRYNMHRPAEVEKIWIYLKSDGTNAGMMPLAHDLMYMWCTSYEDLDDYKQGENLAEQMRANIASIGGLFGEMRDRNITDSCQVVYRPFEYVDMPAPWYKGSVVLIGDASHASTPQLAQGAAMAMEDAVVLGEETASGGCADEVLQRWHERRYERANWIASTSLRICIAERNKAADPDINVQALMFESRQRTMAPL